MPEVTAVIPTYNSARYVAAAVESVLGQTFADLEVVVIDDGSTDATETVLARFARDPRFRSVRQANAGVARARNRGAAEAHGRYIAFLDADDAWMPKKLERQLAALAGRPGAGASHTAFRLVDSDLRPLGEHRPHAARPLMTLLLTRGNVVGTPSTVVVERGLLERAGGFDPRFSQCADWDLWVRLARLTEFVEVNEPLVAYRVHGGNMSRDVALLERDSVLMLEEAFGRADLPAELVSRRSSALARNYIVLAGSYFRAGRPRDAVRCGMRAARLDPRSCGALASFPLRASSHLASLCFKGGAR